MKIFLTYASEQKSIAQSIAFSLRGRGYDVFLDKDDLPPGRSYDEQIETAVARSDYAIFLISPESVTPGRYTLTELEHARRKWRQPDGFVLPVMVAPTDMASVPEFLRAVTILEPKGNVAAEVASQIKENNQTANANLMKWLAAASIASGLLTTWVPLEHLTKVTGLPAPPLPGLYFGLALCVALVRQLRVPLATAAVALLIVQITWQLAVQTAVSLGGEVQFKEHVVASTDAGSDSTATSGDSTDTADAAESNSATDSSSSAETETQPESQFRQAMVFPGLFGGLVGGLGTWLAAAIACVKLRAPESAVLTTVVGGLIGIVMSFNALGIVFYVIWQCAVASTLGYGISRAR